MTVSVVPYDMAQAGFGPSFAGSMAPSYPQVDDPAWLSRRVTLDPGYQFDDIHVLRLLHHAWTREWTRLDHHTRKGVFISGPTGSGKTTYIEQFFARLRVPLVRFTWKPRQEAQEVLFTQTLENGNVKNLEQGIVLAAKHGWPVLINEADLADPAELMALNDVIDKGLITLPDGTVIQAARGFMVFVTANTAGSMDETGSYAGTRPLNAATLRRFFFIELGYASEEKELEWLRNQFAGYIKVDDTILKPAVQVATKLRQAYEGTLDGLRMQHPMSRPELFDWVEMLAKQGASLMAKGEPAAWYTLRNAFANRLSAADRVTAETVCNTVFAGGSP